MSLFWRLKVFCGIAVVLSVVLLLNNLPNQTSSVKTRFVPNDFKFPRNNIQPSEEKLSSVSLNKGAEKTRELHNSLTDVDLKINFEDFYEQNTGQIDLKYEDIEDTPEHGLDEEKHVDDQKVMETTKYHNTNKKEKVFVNPLRIFPKPTKLSDNMKLSNFSSNIKTSSSWKGVLTSNGHILDCITMGVLGEAPLHIDKEEVVESNMRGREDSEMRKKSFNDVYDTRAWGHSFDDTVVGLNASGKGSSINWAQEVIAILHTVIPAVKLALNKSKVSILDIPCGDMQWMSRFLLTRDDVVYTGMDIVPDLIKRHQEKYKNYPWKFIESDLLATDVNIGNYDIIFNRMMLQHLFFKDIQDALYKFSSSGSQFLLTTTFPRLDENEELEFEDNPGRFRKINLEIPPISLSPPLCIHNDGPSYDVGGRTHFMGLWKLPLTKVKTCTRAMKSRIPFYRMHFYSCSGW